MERGLVGDGELVRPHCEAAPLLESGDAPLDGIAASAPRDPDSSHARLERRRVTGLASGDREIFERNALARELPAFFTPDAYSRHLVQQAEVTA